MVTIRKVPLVAGEIYHIFNRGIDGRITFGDENELSRFIKAIKFYMYLSPPMSLSRFIELTDPFKIRISVESWGQNLVSVMDYCLMPNHFHLILKQETEGGIPHFMSQLLNSYTRYFNIKNKRVGQLFLDQFKNVLVENDYQLLHLARYLHLNPYSSKLILCKNELIGYKWSSFREHFYKGEDKICDTTIVDSNFKTNDDYKKFVFDNADYQRTLKTLRHLMTE
jgi:putative transposase